MAIYSDPREIQASVDAGLEEVRKKIEALNAPPLTYTSSEPEGGSMMQPAPSDAPAGTAAGGGRYISELERLTNPLLQGSMSGAAVNPLLVDVPSFLQSQGQRKFMDFLAAQAYTGYNPISVSNEMLKQSQREISAKNAGAMASARGVQNPALLAVENAKQTADQLSQSAQAGAVLQAQESATNKQIDMSNQSKFLAALEADRQAKMNLQGLRSSIMTGNASDFAKMQMEGTRASASQYAADQEADSRRTAAVGSVLTEGAKMYLNYKTGGGYGAISNATDSGKK